MCGRVCVWLGAMGVCCLRVGLWTLRVGVACVWALRVLPSPVVHMLPRSELLEAGKVQIWYARNTMMYSLQIKVFE